MRVIFLIIMLIMFAQPIQAADGELRGMVIDYLSALKPFQAQFEQHTKGQPTLAGRMWMDAANQRLRFDYDDDAAPQMISDGVQLIIYDATVDEVTHLPLSQTPAAVVLHQLSVPQGLNEMVRESPISMVNQQVWLRTPVGEDSGLQTFALIFNLQPITLSGWKVVDGQGIETRIVLKNIETLSHLPRRTFVLERRSKR